MSFNVNEIIALRLRTLRDIEGVLGSFLVGERGELLGRDVTAACGSDVLALVSGRLQQLCDAFKSASIGGAFESTTLYFPQYKLHIRALSNVYIVAVVSAEVNLPALKMAANMLSRQLLSDLADPRWTAEAAKVAESASRQLRESVEPPARTAYPPQAPQLPQLPSGARESRVPELGRSAVRASAPPAAPEHARTSNVPPPPAARPSTLPPQAARTSNVPPPPAARPSTLPPQAARASTVPPLPAGRATRTSSPPPPPAPPRESRASISPRSPLDQEVPSRDSHQALRQSRSPEQPEGRQSTMPPRSFRGTRVAN